MFSLYTTAFKLIQVVCLTTLNFTNYIAPASLFYTFLLASVLEPQESTIRASDGQGSSSSSTTSSSTQDGINGVLDAMYASGVELGQDVRRARLSADGIENIAISFVGGTTMPATGK